MTILNTLLRRRPAPVTAPVVLAGQTCSLEVCDQAAAIICDAGPVGEVMFLCPKHAPAVCVWVGGNPATRRGCFGCSRSLL